MSLLRATPRRLVRMLGTQSRRLAGPLLVVAFAGMAFAAFSVTANPAQAQGTTAVLASAPTTSASTSKTSTLHPGQQLFDEHCAACHGVNAQGTQRAPSLWTAGPAGVDFYLSTGRMPLNTACKWTSASPSALAKKGAPSVPTRSTVCNSRAQALRHTPFFTPKQIAEITDFVVAQGKARGKVGPAVPSVQPLCQNQNSGKLSRKDCVTLSQGRQLFTTNCAACHNAQGSGGMLANGFIVPSLLQATKTQIAEAPRVGPVPMPKFGGRQLDENQLSAIVHYVRYLQHPEDRGGMPIGHFGPLGEGFVGILLGFGSLLLIVRLMGTRG